MAIQSAEEFEASLWDMPMAHSRVAAITARDDAIRAEERARLKGMFREHGTARARPAPPSAMVEKVLALFEDKRVFKTGWSGDVSGLRAELATAAIAAMFDNLPREAMAQGMFNWPTTDKGWGNISEDARIYWLGKIDAAISAARAQALGSAKGDA